MLGVLFTEFPQSVLTSIPQARRGHSSWCTLQIAGSQRTWFRWGLKSKTKRFVVPSLASDTSWKLSISYNLFNNLSQNPYELMIWTSPT